MQLPRYELIAEKTLMVFEFTSVGPNGNIQKLIKFSETSLKNFYNLAFGDKDIVSGEIDDTVVSNNGDSKKVLATVVASVYAFTNKYKDVLIYVTGSTKSRNRLYRMGISKYLVEIKRDFHVFGLIDGAWEKFQHGKEYSAFVAKRK